MPPFQGNRQRQRKSKWKPEAFRNTITYMAFGLFAMHVLEVLFFVGMAGSAIVVVISFIEDAQELFGED